MLRSSIHLCYLRPCCSRYFCSSSSKDNPFDKNAMIHSNSKNLSKTKSLSYTCIDSNISPNEKTSLAESWRSETAEDEQFSNFEGNQKDISAPTEFYKSISSTSIFEIGPNEFTFVVNEFASDGKKFISIMVHNNEIAMLVYNVWLSIPTSKKLIEMLKDVVEAIENNLPYSSQFTDQEMGQTITMRISENLIGEKNIVVETVYNNRRKNRKKIVVVPSDGVIEFKKTLAGIVFKLEDTTITKSISEKTKPIITLSTISRPTTFNLQLHENDNNVILRISERNTENQQLKSLHIKSTGIQHLLDMVQKADFVMNRYEKLRPESVEADAVLFEESFFVEESEYMVRVLGAPENERNYGNTKIFIDRLLAEHKKLLQSIYLHPRPKNKRTHTFITRLRQILEEYNKWKMRNDPEFVKDLKELEAKVQEKIDEFEKSWTGSAADLFTEKLTIRAKFDIERRQVFVKHGLGKYLDKT